MPKCVDCGEVPAPENKRYCPECGVHFPSALHHPEAEFPRAHCVVCGVSGPEYIRICGSCEREGTLPAQCFNCDSAPLVQGQKASNGQCAQCGYHFNLPVALAEIIAKAGTGKPYTSSLSPLDLEWLFFAAVSYQYAEYGGSVFFIKLSQDGIDLFEDGAGIESEEFSELFWPKLLESHQELDLLDLFERYERNPSLWHGQVVRETYEEGSYLELESVATLDVPWLEKASVRSALSSELKKASFGDLQWLAVEVNEMLQEDSYF